MRSFLELEENGRAFRLPARIFSDAGELKAVSNKNAWRILQELAEKPNYAAGIAKKLRLNEQKAYYYLKQLERAGFIEVDRTEEIQGALAKYYRANSESFALVVGPKNRAPASHIKGIKKKHEGRPEEEFLKPFIHNGRFSARIIVGSPDPHGPAKARTRDAHIAIDLAVFFGVYSDNAKFPITLLDTEIPGLEKTNENLIIVGGPITNRICKELNQNLPISFVENVGPWTINSKASKTDYTEEATGIIVKTRHPFFPGKSVLLVAGIRNAGTRAAVIALTKNLGEIAKGNQFDRSLSAKVVEGLDLDGDGQIDAAEIKE